MCLKTKRALSELKLIKKIKLDEKPKPVCDTADRKLAYSTEKSFSSLCFFVRGDDDTFDPVSECHMSTSSCPVTLTAHSP